MNNCKASIDLPGLYAALRPIVKRVLNSEDNAKHVPLSNDERTRFGIDLLQPIVEFLKTDIELEKINAAMIEFGDKHPEVGCLRGKKIKVKKKVGSGIYGSLFEINASTAVKVIELRHFYQNFEQEVEMSKLAAKLKIGPQIIDAFVCTAQRDAHYGVIIMENVKGVTLKDWLRDETNETKKDKLRDDLLAAIQKMHANKLYHNDLWGNNVMVTTKGDRPVIIDFGMASRSPTKSRRMASDKRHPDFDVMHDFDREGRGTYLRKDTMVLAQQVYKIASDEGILCLT